MGSPEPPRDPVFRNLSGILPDFFAPFRSALGMERPDQEERKGNRRRALRLAGAGLLILIAGMALGGYARPGLWTVLPVTAGYLGLVLCVRRALLIWDVAAFGVEDSPENSVETGRARPPARPRSSSGGRSGALRLPG